MKNNSMSKATAAAILIALYSFATAAADEVELAAYVPPEALVYIEFADLAGSLQALLGSEAAAQFPDTRAFQDFTRSKLFNKLAERISELEEVTGFGLSLENAAQLTGQRAALALYDIGELRLLFLTSIAPEKLAVAGLWNLRENFDSRRVGDLEYYVKEDPDGRVALAFCTVGDKLLVGTDVIRFEQALALLNGQEGANLAADERFAQSLPAEAGFSVGALYLDQERINRTPHFRSYWIWENQPELTAVQRVFITVDADSSGITETRWLTVAEQAAELQSGRALAGALPAGADYYYLGCVQPGEVGRTTAWELFDQPDEQVGADLQSALAGAAPAEYAVAATAAQDDEGFFVEVSKVVAIRLNAPANLNREALEAALAGFAERRLLAQGQASLAFADSEGARVLQIPLLEEDAPAYAVREDLLLLGSSAAALGSALAPEPGADLPASDGACAVLEVNLTRAGEHMRAYFKTVAQRNNWRTSANAVFFWRNVTSLLESVDFIGRVTLIRSYKEGKLREEVSYLFGR